MQGKTVYLAILFVVYLCRAEETTVNTVKTLIYSPNQICTTQSDNLMMYVLAQCTAGDKIIELHGIKLDNTYGAVRQVQFVHCNFSAK